MRPKDDLTTKAAQLARAAPNEWRGFLEALAGYNDFMRASLVQSPLAELQINQGKAQAIDALTKHLRDCLSDAEQLARKAKT